MAEISNNSNDLPTGVWLKTKSTGVYIRPQDTQGQFFISALVCPDKLHPFWYSTWDFSELAQVRISGTQVVQIPGLPIVPDELPEEPNLFWEVLWKHDENLPGLMTNLRALNPNEAEFFARRRERNNQRVEDAEQNSASEAAAADVPQGEVQNVVADEHKKKVKQDDPKHPNDTVPDSQDQEQDPGDDSQSATQISRTPRTNATNALILHVFAHNSVPGILTINASAQIFHLKTTKNTRPLPFTFNRDSLIQISPFPRGLTLRFLRCGLTTRPGKPRSGHLRPPAEEWKIVYVHLPNGFEGVVHRGYGKGDYKQYGAEEQGRRDEGKNAGVWGAFVEGCRMVVGRGRVRRYVSRDKADGDRGSDGEAGVLG